MSKKASKLKTLENLEAHECRWPIGDPRQEGFHFCGAPKVIGRPYCAHHWEMSFVPGKGRGQSSTSAQAPLLIVRAA